MHNDKRIKPQDIPHVWAKFLSEKSETEYPEIREEFKKKKKQVANDLLKKKVSRGDGDLCGQVLQKGKPGKSLKYVHVWPNFPSPHQPMGPLRGHTNSTSHHFTHITGSMPLPTVCRAGPPLPEEKSLLPSISLSAWKSSVQAQEEVCFSTHTSI